jgi:DNA-binding CsgD family transcriptional regulator
VEIQPDGTDHFNDARWSFTPRQRQVVSLIAAGLPNDEVARRIGISPRTARAHADALRAKLSVRRRQQIPLAYRAATGCDPLFAARIDS